ncbi:putative ATP-dependent RNA helicase DHR1 [Elasticomyces elasticus]|nr:putative ATP-dependent RNA helicase DHR1 [Elasticomyces elasticus]
MATRFIPRERKHKVLARKNRKGHGQQNQDEANAPEILPADQIAKQRRKEALRDELRSGQPVASGKKRKRLDKYIETKLRREDNAILIKKLAAHQVDTSLLRSSKQLGRQTETKRERFARALKERAGGVNTSANEAVLFEKGPEVHGADDLSDSSADDILEDDTAGMNGRRRNDDYDEAEALELHEKTSVIASENTAGNAVLSPPRISFGSGLKHPLELDKDGNPTMPRRKKRKIAKRVEEQAQPTSEGLSEPEWEGFSSEDDGRANGDADNEVKRNLGKDSESSDISEAESVTSDDNAATGSSADSDEDLDDEESDTSESGTEARRERSSAFKAWAEVQRNAALGFQPSTLPAALPSNIDFKPRAPETDPLPQELLPPSSDVTMPLRPLKPVIVTRDPAIEEVRLKLPVVAEEQKIMEAINNNSVVVVAGSTGSGKTTQVPQFFYEAGYAEKGMIAVTQPRRVAAVSMAQRVGVELGRDEKWRVGHQIRFDTTVSPKTAIVFMTDGILLREIQKDFVLSRYSVVVIDEAHERSVNTDILIGMLSRIVDLRAELAVEQPDEHRPLKMVIMSATLRLEDFTRNERLFRKGPPPIVEVEGRQFPVTMHFARKTQYTYVEEMFQKVSRGHRKLPPGGMLVFLTGQNEISTIAKRLRETFTATDGGQYKQQQQTRLSAAEAPLEEEDMEFDTSDVLPNTSNAHDDDYSSSDEDDGFEIEDTEQDMFPANGGSAAIAGLKVHILPLYSKLPTAQQLRVFEPSPEGSRLIVLATNVAETSLTIPGIRYVFDSGRSKEKSYNSNTGVESFNVGWISKASASQRAGRAGRTGPGHCYRMYSSAIYERDFEEFAQPEILRMPVEGVVLQLKSIRVDHVVNFPFPTPPDRRALAKAEKLLTYLNALDASGKVTETGKALAAYPLSPRFGRVLLLGYQFGVTEYAIMLVAALAVPELFISESALDLREPSPQPAEDDRIRSETDNRSAAARTERRKAYNKAHATMSQHDATSDAIKFLSALALYLYAAEKDRDAICEDFFLHPKAMKEAGQLREQLTFTVRTQHAGFQPGTGKLKPPDRKQIGILKQIAAAGFIDNLAIRADALPNTATAAYARKPRKAIEVPYVTLFKSHERGQEQEEDPHVYIHPTSVLAHTAAPKTPTFLVYSHLSRATPRTVAAAAEGSRAPPPPPKTRLHPLTSLSAAQIAALTRDTPLLDVGKPVGRVETLARDQTGRERRRCDVGLAVAGEKGGQGWPLGTKRVVQVRERGSWLVQEWE